MKDDDLVRAWLAEHQVKVIPPVEPKTKKARQGYKRWRAAKAFKAGGRLS